MTTLHPDLLRACAAYLKHSHAYALDSDDQMALLRADSRDAIVRRQPRAPVGVTCQGPTDPECDEFTHAHIEAIRGHSRVLARSYKSEPGQLTAFRFARQATTDAILDATPAMLAWWCERLAR